MIDKLVYGGDGLARIPNSQPGSGKSVLWFVDTSLFDCPV